jgi:hypothetical protein
MFKVTDFCECAPEALMTRHGFDNVHKEYPMHGDVLYVNSDYRRRSSAASRRGKNTGEEAEEEEEEEEEEGKEKEGALFVQSEPEGGMHLDSSAAEL